MGPREIPFAQPVIAPEAAAAVERVLRSGWVTTGPECSAFEDEFAAWLGVSHAVSVSSCTAAIELALRAMRLPSGSRVLVPAITFCGAVEAVAHAGHIPVLTDSDEATGQVSELTCATASRDVGGVQGMVALHYAGFPAPVQELAAAAGVPLSNVVEDAAHALGTRVDQGLVGGLSRATCFSFYATKNLPIGEGGMVTTEDEELAGWVRTARMHGMTKDAWRRYLPGGSWRYSVEEAGLKANLSDVHAAIGRVQLRHLDQWQQRRHEIAARYTAGLAGTPGLRLPPSPEYGVHAWHLYVVRVGPDYGVPRDELSGMLTEQRIGTSVHFIPLHHMPHFRNVSAIPASGLAGADATFDQVLSLPLHPGLSDDDVDRTIQVLLDTHARSRYQEVSL